VNHRCMTSLIAVAVLLFGAAARAQPPASEAPARESATFASKPMTEPTPESAKAHDAATTDEWKTTLYGFVEFDAMRDSTQSFGDSVGNGSILRSDGSSPVYLPLGTEKLGVTYGATHPRMVFTARNSRVGLKLAAPEAAGMKVSGLVEIDFMGNQPNSPFTKFGEQGVVTTESAYFTNPAVRMRHAYVKVESSIVDVLAGQYYHLFGWQPIYFPAAVSFLGLPNEIFGRTPQLRVTKTIETNPVNFQIAGAALRPPQADAGMPDLHGGIRFAVNGWKGAHMAGSGQPTHDPMSVGVTGAYRQLKVAEYANNVGDPRIASKVAEATAFGVSIDGTIPIIPISNLEDRSNALTVTGAYVTGAGIGDLFTGGLTGGAPYPRPEAPTGPFTGYYAANIDPGIVMFDAAGNLRLINWKAVMVGVQYYLPVLEGRVVVAANFTRAASDNLRQQNTPDFIAEKNAGGDPTRTFRKSDYYDANVFVGITRSLKTGLSWQHVEQTFLATGLPGQEVMKDSIEKNDRFEIAVYLFF
jgi:hypothetical protein